MPEDNPQDPNDLNNDGLHDGYQFSADEVNSIDCVKDAKALGLDMRAIDTKMNELPNARAFVKWYQEEYGPVEKK